MSGAAAPLLDVTGIETFYGPIQAIRGVSLQVAAGQIVTVLGANGAGKTTVLRTISGVLDPERGQVRFEGRDIAHLPPDRVMRLGICHVPEGREVFPFLTVHENLLMGAYSRHDKDAVHRDLELCYGYFPVLKERAHQRAGLLSGGEQQMLAISRALMGRPKLLLLDEPSLGLVAASWSPRSSASSAASTRSRASPSCWSSRMPTWRCRPPISVTCWRSGASCWRMNARS